MNEREALLANVLRVPEDDTARLVMADWLQENGQPERAEFIRVQVQLHRWEQMVFIAGEMPFDADGNLVGPNRDELRYRESVLHGMVCESFWAHSDILIRPGDWRRGFVESLTCKAEEWFTHADAILAAHPVTRVFFTQWWTAGEFRKRDGILLIVRGTEDFFKFVHGEWPHITFDQAH